jgi:biopolymer transport protein ExbB/TolQ
MLQTSKDFLFVTLGVAVLVISFFSCLLLYYLIRAAKEFYRVTASVKKIGERVDETAKTVKEKILSFSLLPLLSEAIKVGIDFLREKKKEKKDEE